MTAGTDRTAEPTVAVRLRISASTELRVLLEPYSGRRLVHVREFVLTDENSFVPTPKGVAIDASRVGEVLEAVRELRAAETRVGVVATLGLGSTKEIRFSVAEWKGATKADIRTWFQKPGSPEFFAGKGVRFNLTLLRDLERGLELLEDES